MSDRLTRTEVSRLTGLSEAGLRWHIKAGNVEVGPDGKLSYADAEHLRNMRNVVSTKLVERTERHVRSRVQAGAVKLKRLHMELRQLQAGLAERDQVAAALPLRAEAVTARIATWPDRYAEQLAREIETDLETARAILRDFAAIALDELGDLKAEGVAALNRLTPRAPQENSG